MTENRKRVSVSVHRGGRTVSVAAARASATRTVSVAALPVRSAMPYDGPYAVDPTFAAQTLPTNGLRMTDDLTVNGIYVGDTSNPQGGVTIFIGGEFIG